MRTISLIAISCLVISSTSYVSATIAESERNLRPEPPLMVDTFTLGLSELIVLPTMLADLPRELGETHEVRISMIKRGRWCGMWKRGRRLRPDHEGSRRPGPWELLPCAQDNPQNSFAEIGAILKFPLITLWSVTCVDENSRRTAFPSRTLRSWIVNFSPRPSV